MFGNHIEQKGSNITSERLRFDFNFDRKLTEEEVCEVEKFVNDAIKASIPVERCEMILKDAKEKGAYGIHKAEDDEVVATKVNVDAVRNLGIVANKYGAKIVHVSTDYVFDGRGHKPYTEDMAVSPTNVYGRTKLAGEEALMDECKDAIVIRTSWLYSSFGNNFVKTMLRLGRERDTLNVIFDQVGTPTYAADLAQIILTIIAEREWVAGVYHFSNEGVCSWYDFTIMIHKMAGIDCKVNPIESSAYPVRTPRPHYSVLNKTKIKTTFNVEVPYWVESLQRCLDILEK
jgi:dTDP-4-dehydrorhamnose reductase